MIKIKNYNDQKNKIVYFFSSFVVWVSMVGFSCDQSICGLDRTRFAIIPTG